MILTLLILAGFSPAAAEGFGALEQAFSQARQALAAAASARDAFTLQKKFAADSCAPDAYMALARLHEKGVGTPADPAEAYKHYASAIAAWGHPEALSGLQRVQGAVDDSRLAEMQRQTLAGIGAPPAASVPLSAQDFSALLRSAGAPRVYLSGAWGFPDFKADCPSYGDYGRRVKDTAWRPGHHLLKLVDADVKKLGYRSFNTWVQCTPDILIDGVMFGAGPGIDGKPWAEGSLKDKTLSRERLLHWIGIMSVDFRLDPKRYVYSRSSSWEELAEVYREMVGDAIYRANKDSVAETDIMFINLNAYRGDADDGTVSDLMNAIARGNRVLVLVDEHPAASLSEGIFGRKNRWNLMISGIIKEHPGKITIYHKIEDVLARLQADRK